MRSHYAFVAIVFLSLIADVGRAAEDGFYFGAAVGTTVTGDKTGLGDLFDDRDSSFKVIGGWRPFDWFAIEGSYIDLGRVALRQTVPDLSPFRLRQKGYAAFGVFLKEVGIFDLLAKTGVVRSSADLTVDTILGPLRWTDHDTDFAWGLGAQARFGRLGARLEYERFQISNGDGFKPPKLISFGIAWTFSSD